MNRSTTLARTATRNRIPQGLLAAVLGCVALAPGAAAQGSAANPGTLPGGVAPVRRVPVAALFHGAPGGVGEVRLHDALDGALLGSPVALRHLRLLPLDHVGRTTLHEWLPDRPRYERDVLGASRLLLPDAQGSLYHFQRVPPGGAPTFGYLWVPADGRPVKRLERPGTGAGGLGNPFVEGVAVAPDGRSLLVATTLAAGGDLLELHLPSGRVFDRTRTLPPQLVPGGGLWLNDDWGFAVVDDAVLRFQRDGTSMATPVPFPGATPTWFSGEAVVSNDRSHAAFVAGAGPTQAHVWVFGATGDVRRASDQPAEIPSAGFLPEVPQGPYLAVSDDGTLAAWRIVTPLAREVVLAEVQPAAPPPVQVTADAYFADTFDEVGLIGFLRPDRVSYALGSVADPLLGGIETADVYDAWLNAQGQPLLSNRSATSGDNAAPFLAVPNLSPVGARWVPGVGVLMHDDELERIFVVDDGALGSTTLLDQVKELGFVETDGDQVLMAVRRSWQPKPWQLFRLDGDLATPATLVHAGSTNVEFRFAGSLVGGELACVARWFDTTDELWRVDVTNSTVDVLATPGGAVLPPLGPVAYDALLFTLGPPAGPNLPSLWGDGLPVTAQGFTGQGFWLPSR